MMDATIETLEEEMGLYGVTWKRIALQPEHIRKYDLPHDPTAAKKSDTRYRAYKAKYWDVAVDLDALHPKVIQEITKEAIEAEVDVSRFETEREKKVTDRRLVAMFRNRMLQAADAVEADLLQNV